MRRQHLDQGARSAHHASMARVFIIGCTGGVGSRVAAHVLRQGDQAVGLHRRPPQADALRRQGVEPVQGDLTSLTSSELSVLMAGCDAVVFTAGAPDAGVRAADLVDGKGLVLAAEAAAESDVRRFLHISAFPDAWRDRHMPADFEHYMRVKRAADVYLAATDLDWVIVRPGTLTDGLGTGQVRLGPAVPYGDVARDDVAAVFAALVHAPHVTRQILELTGGDTPIADAVEAFRVGNYPAQPAS
jgi:uncharacterized protein YbjT (DUF2867 family)